MRRENSAIYLSMKFDAKLKWKHHTNNKDDEPNVKYGGYR